VLDGEFNWRQLMRRMAEAQVEMGVTTLIAGEAATGQSKGGAIGSVLGGLVGGPLGAIAGGLLGGLFQNPINDAWARYEGQRFGRFFREGVEREETRMPERRAEPATMVTNNVVNNIRTIPQNPRETARELVRFTERVGWG